MPVPLRPRCVCRLCSSCSLCSRVLLALEVVGRIILAKNPWSGAFVSFLGLDSTSSLLFGGGPTDDFNACGLTDGLRPSCMLATVGLVPRSDIVLGRRLRSRTLLTVGLGGACSPCFFAADDAVGASKCDGNFRGRVGDLGRGLWKPMPDVAPEVVLVLALDGRFDASRSRVEELNFGGAGTVGGLRPM